MMQDTLPPYLDMCIRALGVIPKRHAPVHIPEPKTEYVAWKPTPGDKECPF